MHPRRWTLSQNTDNRELGSSSLVKQLNVCLPFSDTWRSIYSPQPWALHTGKKKNLVKQRENSQNRMATSSSTNLISLALPIEVLGFHLAGEIGLRVFSISSEIPVLDEPKPRGNSFQFGWLSYVPPRPFYILLARIRPSPDNFPIFSNQQYISNCPTKNFSNSRRWTLLDHHMTISRLKVIDSPNMYTRICYPCQTLHK